jgi:LPXTG-motif cell wall-anchored protein
MQRSKESLGALQVVRVAAFALLLVALMSVMFAGVAAAQTDPYGNGGPDVDAEVIGTGEERGDDVAGDSTLPFTGADLTLYVAIGALAIGSGVWLVRRNRAREDAS